MIPFNLLLRKQLEYVTQQTSLTQAVFTLFKNCSSEGYSELLIGAYPNPGAAVFHSTTLVSCGESVLLTE